MTREERVQEFQKWKQELVSREPTDTPMACQVAERLQYIETKRLSHAAIYGINKNAMLRFIDDSKVCGACGLDMTGYSLRETTEHFIKEIDKTRREHMRDKGDRY